MRNQQYLYKSRHMEDSLRIGVAEEQTGNALNRLGITQKLLRRQSWRTVKVGGLRVGVSLFLGYLLIKK